MTAVRASDTVAIVRTARLVTVSELSEVASTIMQSETTAPSLTSTQIEAIVNNVRNTIVDALTDERSVMQLRPPLITREVARTCNLHLVAFEWYGDITRADELLRLNPTLNNPNNVQAGMTLYAYAK